MERPSGSRVRSVIMIDGLTGKYGIYFPCDGKTVHVYPNEKDMRFGC